MACTDAAIKIPVEFFDVEYTVCRIVHFRTMKICKNFERL